MFFPDALTRGQGEDDNATIMAAESFSESLHLPAMPNISVYNPETRAQREKREEKEGRVASAFGVLGIWTGEDERFAYVRDASLPPQVLHLDAVCSRESCFGLDALAVLIRTRNAPYRE